MHRETDGREPGRVSIYRDTWTGGALLHEDTQGGTLSSPLHPKQDGRELEAPVDMKRLEGC